MKVSLLITAFKEERTIAKCLRNMVDVDYFKAQKIDFEVLLAAPDLPTREVALAEAKKLGITDKFIALDDPGGGKPKGLNLLLKHATGDILIFTDGDVYFGKSATKLLIAQFNKEDLNKPILVTGRPISEDSKNSMMGYFGHLLADAAHHKRRFELLHEDAGMGSKFVKRIGFFPVSGYIYAASRGVFSGKNEQSDGVYFPENTLVDDAFISYKVHNAGGKIKYAQDALAFIKYPANLSDYFKQKKRSTGGYVQLWDYGVVTEKTKTRSAKKELEYFWFPFKYAKNIKELFWSLMLYPIRAWLWIMIFWERRVVKKDFVKTWVRIESTK